MPYVVVEQSRERAEERARAGFPSSMETRRVPEVLADAHLGARAWWWGATPDAYQARAILAVASVSIPDVTRGAHA